MTEILGFSGKCDKRIGQKGGEDDFQPRVIYLFFNPANGLKMLFLQQQTSNLK
jgi:hypothetical protein